MRLAGSGFESRYWVRSSRPCSAIRCLNRASAVVLVDVLDRGDLGQGGDILAELGDLQSGAPRQLGDDLDLLLDELEARVEARLDDPEAASRTSIRTIVAVAAMLITALRQKPCQARFRLNATNEIKRLILAVVGRADLVADDPAVLEGDHPPAQRRDDLGVVGRHQDRHARAH